MVIVITKTMTMTITWKREVVEKGGCPTSNS